MIKHLSKINPSKELNKVAKTIRLLIVDIDGVMTDGGIIFDNQGNELKKFNVRDGHGIKMLLQSSIEVAIITGRSSKVVDIRAKDLGIKEVYQGCYDKSKSLKHLLKKLQISNKETAYIGDDVVDISILKQVGLPIVVNDAVDEIKNFAKFITKNSGGKGAVREVCELIIKSKGLWKNFLNEYSKI